MKILAAADIHGDLSALEHLKKEVKEKKVDYVICAGDFTFFENYIEIIIKKLSQIGAEVILIHGNHEYDEVVKVLCNQYKNMHFIHNRILRIKDYIFIGHGGGGFVRNDPEFVRSMKKLEKNIKKTDKIILVIHAPPYKTKIDLIYGYGHVGNKDYRKFIETHNVVLSVSGHIHEGFGNEDRIKKARVISPGPEGKIVILGD